MLRKGCWEHVCKNSRRWGACLLVCGDSESTQHARDAGNFCLDRLGLALAFALALRELAVLALEGGLEIRQKAGWHAAVALVLLHRKRSHLAGQVVVGAVSMIAPVIVVLVAAGLLLELATSTAGFALGRGLLRGLLAAFFAPGHGGARL